MYHVHDGAYRGQKGVSEPLELMLQVIVSYLLGCWELNLVPMQKQAMFLSCWPTTQAPGNSNLKLFLILFNILKIHVVIDVYAL